MLALLTYSGTHLFSPKFGNFSTFFLGAIISALTEFFQIERALCDEWLSNVRSSTLSRVIFSAIVENWHPELYPDDIVDDEDFVDHLYCFVSFCGR